MDIFLRNEDKLVRMNDKIEINRDRYLVTSSLDGKNLCVLGEYKTHERALEILNRIDNILDKAIAKNANTVSISIPSDE